VHTKRVVRSPECVGCLSCVDACPRGALEMRLAGFPVSRSTFAALLFGTLLAFVAVAKLSGHWNAGVTYQEYAYYLPIRYMISH
jgi:polyferredoxin